MKKILLSIFVSCLILQSGAQWSKLTSVPLNGSDYEGIIYTGTSVILATQGGVFRSVDNGLNWNHCVNGLDTNRLEIQDITYLKAKSEIWVVSGGLYKSTDDGVTWSKVALTGISTIGGVSQISHVGNRLIILYNEWDNILFTNIFKLGYSDDGITWSFGATLGNENTSNWNFIHDDNDYAVYIVEEPRDSNPAKLWFSTDGTSKILHPVTGLPTNAIIREDAFSVDLAGTNLFFNDQQSMKFYRYNPLTTSWSEKTNGIGGADLTPVMTLGLNNLGAHLFGAVVFVNLSMEMSVKLYYSSDLGENWTVVSNPGVPYPVFEDKMVIAGSGRIIGNCFNARLAYSDNTGQTWTLINSFYGGEFNSLAATPGGALFTHTIDQEQGVLKSEDNGNTWTVQNGDLPNFQGIYIIDALFSSGSTLFATLSENPFDEKLSIYKTINSGVNWTKITSGPDTRGKYFAGRHGTYPIVFFTDDRNTGTYQFTTNEGVSWTDISGIAALGLERIYGIKSNGTKMILFGFKNGGVKAYMSTDNGSNFSDITFDLTGPNREVVIANQYEWEVLPQAIAGYSNTGDFIAAVQDNTTYPWKIDFYKLKSTNDGWIKSGTLGVDLYNSLVCYFFRNVNGVWLLGSSAGIYASIDNSVSWKRVWNNQGFLKGIKIRSVMANDNLIMIGTYGNGIWRAPLAEPVLTTLNITNILETSATGGASVSSTGGLPFADKGLCWSTNPSPSTSDYSLSLGNSWTSSFTGTMQPLLSSTKYYVRAYIMGPKGTTYGNEVNFTTTIPTGIESEINSGKVSLYPNPADKMLNISTDGEYSMTMIDGSGRNVHKTKLFNGVNSINVENLPSGLYFIKIKGKDGRVQTLKVLIE